MKQNCIATERFYFSALEFIFHWLTTVLTVVASLSELVNFLLLFVIALGIYRKKVPAKRLLFVANRSIVDLIAAGLSLFFIRTNNLECNSFECETVTFVPDTLMQMIIVLNYWMLSASYFGIGMLTFYAVRNPLKYKLKLGVCAVARFIAIGWLIMISLLVGITLTTEQQVMFDANGIMYIMRNQWSQNNFGLMEWTVAFCSKVIDHSMVSVGMFSLIVPIFSYLTTLFSYAFVAFVLFQRKNDRRNLLSKQQDHTAIWRLGVHLGVFTFSFLLMALSYAATFPMAESCLNWSEELSDQHARYVQSKSNLSTDDNVECNLEHIYAFTRYVSITSLAAIGWFLRMSIDPLIDIILDTHIRRLIFGNRSLERASTTLVLENRLSAEPSPTALIKT